LTEHRGVLTLGDDTVDVTVALANGRVRLTAGSHEIGDWREDDCRLSARDDGTWLIEAENESLPFRPADPIAFARAMAPPVPDRTAVEPDAVIEEPVETDAPDRPPGRHRDPEAPKATTVIGFYALAAATAVLGIWALFNLLG
jgi:hypothetical protein